MDDISFFMLAYKQKKATDFCLKTIRKYYKTNKIIVFENNSNILFETCNKYNATYIHQPINYMSKNNNSKYAHMQSLNDFKLFINQHKIACEQTNTKWIVYLEPDVVLRSKITNFPKKSVGGHIHKFNIFVNRIKKDIDNYRTDKNLPILDNYYYSCAGGCIINRKDLEEVINTDWAKCLNNTLNNYPSRSFCQIRCGDVFISYLFLINGYSFEDWKDYCDPHTKDKYRLAFAPVIHGFKYYYD
jgi:hypothetical protein